MTESPGEREREGGCAGKGYEPDCNEFSNMHPRPKGPNHSFSTSPSPTLHLSFFLTLQKVQPIKSSPCASQAVSSANRAMKQIEHIIYLHILRAIITFHRLAKLHTLPVCPRCLKWTWTPWWLYWNLISRSPSRLYIVIKSQYLPCAHVWCELKYPMLQGVIWGYKHRHRGPSMARAERVQRGRRRPSSSFPLSFSLSRLSQALTA